jgi:hypothetical protein
MSNSLSRSAVRGTSVSAAVSKLGCDVMVRETTIVKTARGYR